jgi:hypothetical protein
MSLVLADRVRETTTSTGTGTITLGGAVSGFQSFSVIGNNNTTYYTISGGTQWEVGIGTYYGGTLARTTVISSSTGSILDLAAGSKDVFVTYPAKKSVNQDANNRVLIPYTSGTTNVGSLNVGDATVHTDSGVIAGFTASEPLYLYTSLQNTDTGATSYASYAVNDGGHTAYGELGINNANYSYSAAGFPNNGFSTPLASFVESYGGPLVLGSWDSQKISFIVNGAVNTTDAMTINTNGSVAFNGQVGTAGQVLQSNATSAPTWVTPASGGTVTSVSGTGTVSGISLSGTVTTSGNLTLGGTLDLSSPPAIGATSSSTGKFTTLESTGTASLATGSTTSIQIVGDASYPQVKATGGTNTPLVLTPLGTGALQAQKTDSTTAGGNARGSNAVDWQAVRAAATNVASGSNSIVSGGQNNTASNSNSTVVGGATNNASGNGAVAGGNSNTASAATSVAFGNNNLSNAAYSTIAGGQYGTSRSIIGYAVFSACNSPVAASAGVSQGGLLVLGVATTDATATVLRSNTSAVSATNQVALPNNSAYVFKAMVIAGVTGAGNTSAWKLEGAIKRGVGVGTTAIVGTVTATRLAYDAGASGWLVTATADTTNGALAFTVTGQASTTIRWVCKVETTEMTY